MIGNSVTSPNVAARPFTWRGLLFAGCAAAIWTSGCAAARKKPVIPWSTAILVRPNVPAPETGVDVADADPDLKLDLPQPPALPYRRAIPPRPRVVSVPPTENESVKADVPLIAPQLSPEEKASAQQQTSQSINEAEKNLAATKGKSLNAAQADLASKVRGFISDAHEAVRVGDWSGAQSLARKAQFLSEELVRTL